MTPSIKIENGIGNIVRIQNDIQKLATTYLSRDTTVGLTSTLVENTSGFRGYSTTISSGSISLGTQTWTVGSTANMRVNDIVITTGASSNVPAIITGITNATTVVVNVPTSSGSGTATGLTHTTPVLVGIIGAENTELNTTNTITSKTQLSTSSGLSLYHNTGEEISEIAYDKIEIYKSDTELGSYTQIATIDFNVKSNETVFNDPTSGAGVYYKVRFVNSGTAYPFGGNTSYYGATDFATGTSASSVTSDTAKYLIDSVKSTLGIDSNDSELNDNFFLSALNDARRIYDTDFTFGRNNEWRQEFNYPIKMKAGSNFINLPTDIDFSETNRSIFRARLARSIGGYNQPMKYVDKSEWNSILTVSSYTTNTSAITSGATSIVLNNTGDLPSNGSLYVATEDYTSNILVITYTANNKDTNTLTGVTGVTRNISAGTQFWLNPVTAIPSVYTVWNGVLYFDRPIPQSLQGKNVFIDYYKKITDITNTLETIPEHFRDVYKHYLKYAVKKRRDDNVGEKDPDYQMFLRACNTVSNNHYTGQKVIIIN